MFLQNSIFKIIWLIIITVSALCTNVLVNAEVVTAETDCEPLLDIYKNVIEILGEYLSDKEDSDPVVEKYWDRFKMEYEWAMKDIQNYLANPINLFLIIKRLTIDVSEIKQRIKHKKDLLDSITSMMEKAKDILPSQEDLKDAANTLTRLKALYKLNVTELSEGIIKSIVRSTPMMCSDCYELGRILYHDTNYKDSLLWMSEALRKYHEEEGFNYFFNNVDIIEYISHSYYLLGDFKNALMWTKYLLSVDPDHEKAKSNLLFYKEAINDRRVQEDSLKSFKRSEDNNVGDINELLPSLCRGEYDIPPIIYKGLKCFYSANNHPFLRLAPIKSEQLYVDPDVFLFYDVMSDREIEHIKQLATPQFQRALVYDQVSGKPIGSQQRISKSAFLLEDDVIAVITQRASDFTGLSMTTAENLQVANYGIGGHYLTHYDFDLKHDNTLKETAEGNRIATVLFYMSEVAEGGATVFPILGLRVRPVKHAALFWTNLHPSGEGDLYTAHAACPVLLGSKWVSNKWIRAVGQEFHRPCTLEYQSEDLNDRRFAPLVPNIITT